MAEFDPPFERLVPAGEAIELLAKEHDRRGIHSNWSACLDAAHDTILGRLLAGHLVAYAEKCEIDCDNPAAPPPGEVVREEDFFRGSAVCRIPLAFWCHYHNTIAPRRKFDVISSDFSFTMFGDEWDDYRFRTGGAYSVTFDRKGLPAAAVPAWEANFGSSIAIDAPKENRGRKPANWWPDFAEELAFYIHEKGRPETQEALIAAVFDGLARQGRPEPSRTQVQPVVRQLLDRLAKAGN